MTQWVQRAKELGFAAATVIEAQILKPREDVRAMCVENKCGSYQKNWTCPPAVGTVEACEKRIRQYNTGLLLQTVGHLTKAIDSRVYRETEQQHIRNLYTLAGQIRKIYPDALCLGTGGCRVCKQCAYPEECRFPEKAMASMEAYGLFVTQVCREAGVAYHHGEKTITYTACILLE